MKKIILIALFIPTLAFAEDFKTECRPVTKPCLLNKIYDATQDIENQSWRDKSYRELAKVYAYNGKIDEAVALIDKIEKPDTKAMTIRGIGFAAADSKWNDPERYKNLFLKLNAIAGTIEDESANGIALTYIAMAQALAGDDMGAAVTTLTMTNPALRNKAFAESAEIQAEAGRYDEAITSISKIDAESFRNKAYKLISKIMVQQNKVDQAYDAAMKISNSYMRAESLLFIANHDNPEERQPQ